MASGDILLLLMLGFIVSEVLKDIRTPRHRDPRRKARTAVPTEENPNGTSD